MKKKILNFNLCPNHPPGTWDPRCEYCNFVGTKEEIVNQRLDRIEKKLDQLLKSRLIWEKEGLKI